MKVGVILPSLAVQRRDKLTLAEAARHAEDVGLDSVWHGDHLAVGMPTVDCTIALAVAATATSRIAIGASVFIPAIRPLVWAAKQLASLQLVSGGRLLLGVGSGGGPAQWAAAGVPFDERGRRTETALRLFPGLLTGEDTTVAGFYPTVEVPPLWVGNASEVAIDRAARLGNGWFPSLITPARLAAGRSRLNTLASAAGRPVPAVTIGASGALGSADGTPTRAELAAGIAGAYQHAARDAADIPITGEPAEAAERIAEYAADHLVIGLSGPGWRTQIDLLAEVRDLL
ncbi:LLM class flavin-dependent oxidoreductase [Winogradskya humida]|nr:LLM class flavin-dependent oxidoreductase [Actinoplanes humidus]